MASNQPTSLRGRTAVISGGSRGIGLATARLLAAEGCRVAITGRDAKRLRIAAKEVGPECLAIVCNVSDEVSVNKLGTQLKKQFGRLDYLFNNAGIAHASKNVESLSPEDWRSVMETNLTGIFLMCRALLPLMGRGSVVVNNVSVAARQAFPGFSAYCASKAGVLAFTGAMREELRERGIKVTALLPGATETSIWEQFWADAPRNKMVSPETVARAVLHALTLPEGSSIDELTIGPATGPL